MTGQCVETESSCGRIQGLVEGPDQFAFTGIPYTAAPPTGTKRWTHSQAPSDLKHCHKEAPFKAHSHNDSVQGCWRRYPTGAAGDEDCLNLDVYTSSVGKFDYLYPLGQPPAKDKLEDMGVSLNFALFPSEATIFTWSLRQNFKQRYQTKDMDKIFPLIPQNLILA